MTSSVHDRLRAASVGQRWVIRARLDDGSATDVTGWLVGLDDDEVRLAGPVAPTGADAAAAVTAVARNRVVAARRAPAAAGGPDPRRTGAAALERLTVPAWGSELEPLGEWVLRAGGGFSGRANSCLAVGDPGIPVADAAAAVVAYAADHAIAPMAQVVTGSAEDDALVTLGWEPTYVATDVLTVRLATLLGERPADPRVAVGTTLGPAWRSAFDESRASGADPAAVTAVLAGRPPTAFAGVADGERLVVIARGHLADGWLGLSSIWTRPDRRREGLATAAMIALGHWAARRGGRYSYLQVATENVGAHGAYARLGFTQHHRYRYLAPPGLGSPLSGR